MPTPSDATATPPGGHARPTAEVVPATATPGHTIGPFFHDAFAWRGRGSTDESRCSHVSLRE